MDRWIDEWMYMYHDQCPDGVVEKDGGGCDQHACAYELAELFLEETFGG